MFRAMKESSCTAKAVLTASMVDAPGFELESSEVIGASCRWRQGQGGGSVKRGKNHTRKSVQFSSPPVQGRGLGSVG
jgi:hypothetical protein